mmetsp:Transcript_120050/g.208972  ORF Transcript_120050/g.208972 Transcript_120050/m.208972 type:complete len:137 (+) Transcript_120050:935-1345(+)
MPSLTARPLTRTSRLRPWTRETQTGTHRAKQMGIDLSNQGRHHNDYGVGTSQSKPPFPPNFRTPPPLKVEVGWDRDNPHKDSEISVCPQSVVISSSSSSDRILVHPHPNSCPIRDPDEPLAPPRTASRTMPKTHLA